MGRLSETALVSLLVICLLSAELTWAKKGGSTGGRSKSSSPSTWGGRQTKPSQPGNYPRQPTNTNRNPNPYPAGGSYPGKTNTGGNTGQNPGGYPAGGYPNQNPGRTGTNQGGYPNQYPAAGGNPAAGGYPNQYPGRTNQGGYPNQYPAAGGNPAAGGYPNQYPAAGGYPNQYPGRTNQGGYPNQYPAAGGYPNQYPGRTNQGGYPNQYPAAGGYPNQYPAAGGYPVRGGGYPAAGGYPAGGYPAGGYPAGGYPAAGGYPGGGMGGYPNWNPNNKILSPRYGGGGYGYGGYGMGGSPFSRSVQSMGYQPKSTGFAKKAMVAAGVGALAGMAVGYGLGRFPRPHFNFRSPEEEQYYNSYMYRRYGTQSTDQKDFGRDYVYKPPPRAETYEKFMERCMNRTDVLKDQGSPTPKNQGGEEEEDDTVSIEEIGYPALVEQVKARRCVEQYMVYSEQFLQERKAEQQFQSNHSSSVSSGVIQLFSSILMLLSSVLLLQ